MKKIILFIGFIFCLTVAFGQQTRVDTRQLIVRDSINLVGEWISISGATNDQVIGRVDGRWVNTTLGDRKDSVFVTISADTLFIGTDTIISNLLTDFDTTGFSLTISQVIDLADSLSTLWTAIDLNTARDSLDNLADVHVTGAAVDDILSFDGMNWVHSSGITLSGGIGITFYMDDTEIIGTGVNSDYPIKTLSKVPVLTAEDVDAIPVTNNTVLYGAYLYDFALGGVVIDAGDWSFLTYASVNSVGGGRESSITRNIYIVEVGSTITTTGTGTSRTATAASGTPFVTGDASATNTDAGYLQTPQGLYQITGYTSPTIVTVLVPTTYTNESGVTFQTYKKQFGSSTGEITSIGTNYTLYSVNAVHAEIIINNTDKLAELVFGISNNTTTVSFVHNGNLHYSHFVTPLAVAHNDLKGLNAGDSYEHLTQAQKNINLNFADSVSLNSAVAANTGKDTTGIYHANRTDLNLVSGSNTGDQSLTGYLQDNVGIAGGTTLIGGTSVTDTLVLQGTSGNGTLTSPAVRVDVGNDGATEAITVLNNGKVGIGTTSPDYLLHVIGDMELEGVLLVDEYIYHNDDFHTNIRFVSDQIIFNAGGVSMLGLAEGTQDVFRINPNLVDIDFNVFSSLSSGALFVEGSSGNVGIGTIAPTAALHIKAGTATASTAPLKFTSGTLNTTPEAGAVEFLTDAYYGTITTAAERKQFAFTSDIATNIYNEVPTGLINSSNDTYTTASTFVTNSTQTYLNGIRQKLNVHYIESGSTIVFQASYIPQTGDILFLDYQN